MFIIAPADVLPSAYLSALKIVSAVDCLAALAGGAVRDTLNSKPVKDVDIFVGPHVTAEALRAASGPAWVWNDQFTQTTIEEYPILFGEGLVRVIQGAPVDPILVWNALVGCTELPPPIQVVVLNEHIMLDALLAGFDFGFCQVGLQDGGVHNHIYGTAAYLYDQDRNIATLSAYRREVDYLRSLNRAARLTEKYPERMFYNDLGDIMVNRRCPKASFWGRPAI